MRVIVTTRCYKSDECSRVDGGKSLTDWQSVGKWNFCGGKRKTFWPHLINNCLKAKCVQKIKCTCIKKIETKSKSETSFRNWQLRSYTTNRSPKITRRRRKERRRKNLSWTQRHSNRRTCSNLVEDPRWQDNRRNKDSQVFSLTRSHWVGAYFTWCWPHKQARRGCQLKIPIPDEPVRWRKRTVEAWPRGGTKLAPGLWTERNGERRKREERSDSRE